MIESCGTFTLINSSAQLFPKILLIPKVYLEFFVICLQESNSIIKVSSCILLICLFCQVAKLNCMSILPNIGVVTRGMWDMMLRKAK